MDPWAWIAVYLIGFALLQVLLYRYFRRDVPQSETATPGSAEAMAPSARPGGTSTTEGERNCPRCGAVNESEQAYSFCRECAAPLQ